MPKRLDKKEEKKVQAGEQIPDIEGGSSAPPEPVDLEGKPGAVRIKEASSKNEYLDDTPAGMESKPGKPVDLENKFPAADKPVDLEEKPVIDKNVDLKNKPVVDKPVDLKNKPVVDKPVDLEGEHPAVQTGISYVVQPGSLTLFQSPCQFKFDGKFPSMSFNNNNQVVVVYHHSNFFWDMYSCVGKLDPVDGNIEWGKEYRYDQGSYPRVAINNSGVVVQVHESPRKRKTWYHVGEIKGNKVEWGPSYEIGQGLHPAVALSDDDQVVIVEESGGRLFSPESFYFFGKVNRSTKTILFSRKRELLVHSGKELSVTMKGNDIIVAFRHARNPHRLHTMLGKIDGLNVSWAEYEFLCFAEGNWPSVSLNSEGVVVVNWQTYNNRRVWCREGQLKETDGLLTVQWSTEPAREYGHGVYPSLCLLENNRLIEFHGTSELTGYSMWYTFGDVKKVNKFKSSQ